MNNQPLISVVIPTYNRAPKTVAAVECVLAQTYSNLEILVIDDGSTDGSSEIIRRFVSEKTSVSEQGRQIRYYHQANQGPGAARNMGIENARGEYIAFLDSDDVWLPEKLEWQMKTIEQFKGECGACITDALLISNSGPTMTTFEYYKYNYKQTAAIERNAVKILARSFCGYWISTLLARTDLVRQTGGFDPVIFFCEDRDLYFRLAQLTSLAYVNKPLVNADRTTSSNDTNCRTWEKAEVRLRGQQYMLEKWLKTDAKMPPDVRKAVTLNLRETFSQWSNWYLETERYEEARQAVANAIKCELTLGLAAKWVLTLVAPAFVSKFTGKVQTYNS